MKRVILFLSILQMVTGQKIFESFDLDGMHQYVGTTKYEFNLVEAVDEDKAERNLTVSGVKGDIYIEGRIGNTVNIVETIRIRSTSDRKAQQQFNEERAVVKRLAKSNIFEVKGKKRWVSTTSYNYDIIIPVNYSVKTVTAGGDINIESITGEAYLKTSGGDLDITQVIGKITAKTSGGDIDIRKSEGVAILTTSGGEIDISDLKGKLEAATSGGDIFAEHINGDVTVSTSGGSIDLNNIFGNSVNAKTSGGDIDAQEIRGDLDVSTSGGDVNISDVEGSVSAGTSGGDIDLNNIIGAVELSTSAGDINGDGIHGAIIARTSAGDISISKVFDTYFSDHTISLKTSVGNIYLTIPQNIPVRIDAVVDGEHSSDAIESDFPMTIDIKRNQVRGKIVLNAGTHIIKLRASEGIISIDKE